MGKKKAFVDKKKSVTYNLVYRSTEDSDAVPDGVLVDAAKGVRVGRVDADAAEPAGASPPGEQRRYPAGHPLSWLVGEEQGGEALGEARRRELVELGFPDDGYDYLAHLRTLGRGAASMEAAAVAGAGGDAAAPPTPAPDEGRSTGPSVYVQNAEPQPPEVDVRLYDASALSVLQSAAADEDAAAAMGGVTAFSRERHRALRAERDELAEVERLLAEAEDAEAVDEEGEGGLLEDDFVLAATQAPERPAVGAGEEGEEPGESEEAPSDEEGSEGSASWEDSESVEGGASAAGRRSARPGSIASSYWRAERTDRRETLAAIDERFEHLALAYDDDEIGSLDGAGGSDLGGTADLAQYGAELDEFLEAHRVSQAAHEDNLPYAAPRASALREELAAHGLGDEDADVAVAKALEAIRRTERLEAEAEARGRRGGEAREPVWVDDAPRERWDCETILTMTSNLDNHPARISDDDGPRPPRKPRRATFAPELVIQLDKAGMPVVKRGGDGGQGSSGEESEEEEGGRRQRRGGGGSQPARRKGETPEEKKARKAAVKEAQRTARASKKEVKSLFREEAVRAARQAASAPVQAAIQLP